MLMLGVQVLCVISFLFPVTYPEGFGGDRFRQVFGEGTGGGEGGLCHFMGPGQSLVGNKWQSSQKFYEFSTLKSLFINIYLPQPMMKLIQHIFSKI